jgi:tetratricopeptide (TPR) repeat protein
MPPLDILGRRLQARDHSLSVPVPSATAAFGIPNACNICHRDRDPGWAARFVERWYSDDQKDRLEITAAFFFGFRKEPAAAGALVRLFGDRGSLPAARRAAIPMILAGYGDPSLLSPLIGALDDPAEHPLVRFQVVAALAAVPGRLTDATLLRAVLRPEPAIRQLASVEAGRRGLRPHDAAVREALDRNLAEYERLVVEQRQDVAEEWARLADIDGGRGSHARAIARYERALQLKEDLPEAQIQLGTLYGGQGETQKAAARFRTAARLLPDSPVPPYNLGSLYLMEGRPSEALEPLSRALRIDPAHLDARYHLAVAQIETGSFEPALENLKEVVEKRPGQPMARYYLGRAYEATGRLDLAAGAYREALRIAPDLREAREALRRIGA